jgi:hypothetical protein
MSASKNAAGTVKCCMMPGRSQNRTSTNSTPSSAMKRRTSSELVNTFVAPSSARLLDRVAPARAVRAT